MCQQDLVRRFLVHRGGEPHDGKDRRHISRYRGLKKWEADMAQCAAMIRGMMMFVLEGDGGELCGGKRTDHE